MSRHRSHGRLHSGFLIAFSCLPVKGALFARPQPPSNPTGGRFPRGGTRPRFARIFFEFGFGKRSEGWCIAAVTQ
jgi:hypothetical protein